MCSWVPNLKYSGIGSDNGLALTRRWISNHMPSKMWDEITYPFPNFDGATIEVWEWISNFIPHFIMDLITYPRLVTRVCCLLKLLLFGPPYAHKVVRSKDWARDHIKEQWRIT